MVMALLMGLPYQMKGNTAALETHRARPVPYQPEALGCAPQDALRLLGHADEDEVACGIEVILTGFIDDS